MTEQPGRKLTPDEVDRELADAGVEFADESEYTEDEPTEVFVRVPRSAEEPSGPSTQSRRV